MWRISHEKHTVIVFSLGDFLTPSTLRSTTKMSKRLMSDILALGSGWSLLTSFIVILICVYASTLVYPLRLPRQRVTRTQPEVRCHYLWNFPFSPISTLKSQPFRTADPNSEVAVHIRIEGRTATMFDATIRTTGKTVTTTDGTCVTGRADGTNGNEYPFPVPTCTSALADVATGQDGRPVWGG